MIAWGVIALLVGLPIGILMLAKPSEVWKATEGWKYRNPDANEPSGIVLAMSGIGVIFTTCVVAWIMFTAPDDAQADSQPTSTRSAYPSRTHSPALSTTFTPPPPTDRGALGMIGYLIAPGPDGRSIATVYYNAPSVASTSEPGMTGPPPCDVTPRISGAGTDHVTVDINLTWAPQTPDLYKIGQACNRDQPRLVRRSLVVGEVPPNARLYTSTPEANTSLPKLAEAPGNLQDPPVLAPQ